MQLNGKGKFLVDTFISIIHTLYAHLKNSSAAYPETALPQNLKHWKPTLVVEAGDGMNADTTVERDG